MIFCPVHHKLVHEDLWKPVSEQALSTREAICKLLVAACFRVVWGAKESKAQDEREGVKTVSLLFEQSVRRHVRHVAQRRFNGEKS